MNADLEQILTAAENLSRYIRESRDRSSAILVRAQAQKILGHAEQFARDRADSAGNLKFAGIPIRVDKTMKPGQWRLGFPQEPHAF